MILVSCMYQCSNLSLLCIPMFYQGKKGIIKLVEARVSSSGKVHQSVVLQGDLCKLEQTRKPMYWCKRLDVHAIFILPFGLHVLICAWWECTGQKHFVLFSSVIISSVFSPCLSYRLFCIHVLFVLASWHLLLNL